ncbi:MAG: hypothetical protein OGMRLDGQ_002729 [Candidatus Fervidibacter sp.]
MLRTSVRREGKATAEPRTAASSEWRVVFLEGSAPALPKIFGASADAPSSYGISGSPGGSPSQTPN